MIFYLADGFGVDERGRWHGSQAAKFHRYDSRLSRALIDFFKKERAESVVDLGCGLGDYVKALLDAQIPCEGFDGHPNTWELSQGVAKVADLSQMLDLGRRYDWVLSLEVGEHLPVEYEQTFIENLDRHAIRGIVLSWAVKGQGGEGHFNERNNRYIKKKFKNLGYRNDKQSEMELRNRSDLDWFKNTIMVFRRYAHCHEIGKEIPL